MIFLVFVFTEKVKEQLLQILIIFWLVGNRKKTSPSFLESKTKNTIQDTPC